MCLKCGKSHTSISGVKNCDHLKIQEIKVDSTIESLLENLEELKADDLKKVATHFGIKYTNKDETLKAIQNHLGLNEDDIKYNSLIVKLDELQSEEIVFISNHLKIEYTNDEDTVLAIKEFLGIQ